MKVKFWIVLLAAASVSLLVGYGIGTGARCVVSTVSTHPTPSVGAESLTGVSSVGGNEGWAAEYSDDVTLSGGAHVGSLRFDPPAISDDIKITCDRCEVVDYAGKRCEWEK